MKFNLNNFKRKRFFWIDKLQISAKERKAVSSLLGLLCLLLLGNLFVRQKLNYSQEVYNSIIAEFEHRTALIEQQKAKTEQKYNPVLTVKEADKPVDESTEKPQLSSTNESMNKPEAVAERININTATSEQLQTLKGIGVTYAQRIINYRESKGGFKAIEELLKVKGIGKKRLDNIRPFVKL